MIKVNFSILILSYNQEDSISICLDSVLNEEIKPNQILIADDFSKDTTRAILLQYKEKYPQIIQLLFNEYNLGVFGNYNNALQYLQGDIGAILAGDDVLPKKAIQNTIEFITLNKIDYNNQSVAIIGNNKIIYPNGYYHIFNNYRIRNNNPFKEQLRLGLSTRDFGFSIKTIKSCPMPLGYGYSADAIRNLNMILNTENFYFMNEFVSVYKLGDGVTSKYTMYDHSKSFLNISNLYTKENFKLIDKKDELFISYKIALAKYFTSANLFIKIYNYFALLLCTIRNINNFSINNSLQKNIKYLIPFYIQIVRLIKNKILFKKK